jgi:hypothetical protein
MQSAEAGLEGVLSFDLNALLPSCALGVPSPPAQSSQEDATSLTPRADHVLHLRGALYVRTPLAANVASSRILVRFVA